MKYVLMFLVIISFVFCGPPQQAVPAEEAFSEIKKNILECVSKDERASAELKNYALENLNNGYKETLVFSKYRQNETDRLVIRQCRRNAFLFTTKKRTGFKTIEKDTPKK